MGGGGGGGGGEVADERAGALVDEGLELGLGDVGEGEIEDFVGLRDDGGEIAVEEDGVEDSWVARGMSVWVVIGRC